MVSNPNLVKWIMSSPMEISVQNPVDGEISQQNGIAPESVPTPKITESKFPVSGATRTSLLFLVV